MKRLAGIALVLLGLALTATPAAMAGPPELTCQGPFEFGFHAGDASLVHSCIGLGGHPVANQGYKPPA